jgi:hypothetical protein
LRETEINKDYSQKTYNYTQKSEYTRSQMTYLQSTYSQVNEKKNLIEANSTKQKRIRLNDADFLNIIKGKKSLGRSDLKVNSVMEKVIKSHLQSRLEEESSLYKRLKVLSIDNKEGYINDLSLLEEISISQKKLLDHMSIEYFILEDSNEIYEYISNSLISNYSLHQNVKIFILTYSIDNIHESDYDIILCNKCFDRFSYFPYSIEVIFQKIFSFLKEKQGELVVFAYETKSRLEIRSMFNQLLGVDNDFYSAEDIYRYIVKNDKFDIIKNYLVGIKTYECPLNVTNIDKNESIDKNEIFLMTRLVEQRLSDMSYINKVVEIIKPFMRKVNHPQENSHKLYLIEQMTGFFFKRKEENREKDDEVKEYNEFSLPEGVERLYIIEKPVENGVFIKKNYFYSDGSRETIEIDKT